MGSSIHRRDISRDDIYVLARFCRALDMVQGCGGVPIVWELGTLEIWLPVWYQSGLGWQISRYKPFVKEAIGIEKGDMRRICRYLGIREPVLLHLLFKFSMLAVVPGTSLLKPKFRLPFDGVPLGMVGAGPSSRIEEGFVLERRRALGGFK